MKYISLLLFVVLLFVVIFSENTAKDVGQIVKVDGKKYEVLREVHDTLRIPKIVQGRTLPAIINTIHDTIPMKVDTSAILADYYTKYVYSDSIRIDTNGYVFISDTVQKTRLLAGTLCRILLKNRLQIR